MLRRGERERTPLFKLSPGTFTRSGVHSTDGPFEALFVCTGNIARSASGEIISKHLAAEYGLGTNGPSPAQAPAHWSDRESTKPLPPSWLSAVTTPKVLSPGS